MSTQLDLSLYRREPTLEDIFTANTEIHKHEFAINTIQERIAVLLSEVQQLRREQNVHEAAISRCKGVITLARRIPEELLATIFEHCVADGWTLAPIVVSHVCSAWRHAARAPRVWSHVYVHCPAHDSLARTRFWLTMARQAPLDITIVTGWAPDWQLRELMDILLLHTGQWRTLALETPGVSQAGHLLSRVRCSRAFVAPNLCEVDISTEVHFDEPGGDGNDVDEAALAGFADTFSAPRAPRLSTVHFTSNAVPPAPLFPAHLRVLTLTLTESPFQRPLSTAALLALLAGIPALRTLTLSMPLSYEHPFVPAADTARTVVLAQLETLTMYGPTDMNGFLVHLRAPALHALHLRSLEDVGYRQQPLEPSLLLFLTGGTGEDGDAEGGGEGGALPVELLELHDIDLAPDTFARVFAALPGLRELRLHESSIADATVGLLHGPHGLCPRLARVDFRWCGLLRGRALVELVRSRNVVGATRQQEEGKPVVDPIEEVAVINCCFVEEQDVLDLAAMTVCRVIMREKDDYCRIMGCCGNFRYRTRLYLRHIADFSSEERPRIRLIV